VNERSERVEGNRKFKMLNRIKKFFADITKKQWFHLGTIMKFTQLYVLLLTILGVFVAFGYLSQGPNLNSKILEPVYVLDVDKFYEIINRRNYNLTEDIKKLIPKEENTVRDFNFPVVHKYQLLESMKIYDVSYQEKLFAKGPIKEGISDAESHKKDLGFYATHFQTGKSFENLRFQFWQLVQTSVGRLLKNSDTVHGVGNGISRVALKDKFEKISNYQNQTDILGAFWCAQEIISFIIIENTSSIPASNIEVSFNDAGRYAIEPKFILCSKNISCRQKDKIGSILINKLLPKDSFVLVTMSKSFIKKDDIDIFWDKYFLIDKVKGSIWLLLLLILCLLIFIKVPIKK